VKITVPEPSLVVLIGAAGSGKTTFAQAHFKPTEVISSDSCRALVADSENDLSATKDAFEVLHFIAAKRLTAGRLTVIDATNVQSEARKPLLQLAREYHSLPVAVVFNLPLPLLQERNEQRTDRQLRPRTLRHQVRQLQQSLSRLQREGFRYVYVLETPEQVEVATVERQPLWVNRKHDRGPFDIIGDVHGCFTELVALLEKLGYEITPQPGDPRRFGYTVCPPEGRKAIFLGDLVDRGPDSPTVLRLVMGMVSDGVALCLPGNHDSRLLRALKGQDVQPTHGLAETLAQLEEEPPEFKEQVRQFLEGLISHYVFDGGRLVVAHAGMKAELQGRASRAVREFALYGETTGETDEFGLPVRLSWAEEYRGSALVAYGHTPVPEPQWLNHTVNIDTGCVFGGKLTALRYPEKELVSVAAARTYYEPTRPFLTEKGQSTELLDIEDVRGKRVITTRLHGNIAIREENATAALEVMSRFAVDPRWLIYLPSTMAPCETSREPDLLEHPAEAFAYYRDRGVAQVICEEKHMGSRAVVIVCRDAETVRRRFGVREEGHGIVYTRTGRRFFDDLTRETEFLRGLHAALEAAGAWEELETDWVCLDGELLPWSAKAQELLRRQYAAVGSSGRAALQEAVAALEKTAARGADAEALLERYRSRAEMVARYVKAYRRYCWPVESVEDLKFAPFHLLATEGKVHVDRDHLWHLETLAHWVRAGESVGASLMATPHRLVDVTDPDSQAEGIRWWEERTAQGSEGMVVKPLSFIAGGRRGLIQPALKCRGREYLRIIYGPEYTAPENLERLRTRGLGRKRSLALREFALGVEALERFVRREPFYRVHECVFGVLALESEPVDPRL
jgi:protein phosphatase